MKKILFLLPLILLGCASTSDITNLQVQIDGINAKVNNLQQQVNVSSEISKLANDRAIAALRDVHSTNEKLTILLQK